MKYAKTMTLVLMQTALFAAGSRPAQAEDAPPRISYALEADALSFGLKGYSGILNVTLRSHSERAAMTCPASFWKATATTIRQSGRRRSPERRYSAPCTVFAAL